MKIVVGKRDLLDLVSRVGRVAQSRGSMPMLSMVLLDTGKGGPLTASATDLYMAMTDHIEADVEEPGQVAIPAKDLLERLRVMPDGPIVLSDKDGKVTMTAKGMARRFSMLTAPADDFPPIPQPPEVLVSLPAAVLGALIARAAPAISTDETRAHLNSLNLEFDGKRVRAVSTDGHRLHKVEATLDRALDFPGMLVPLKAIREVAKLCEGVNGDVSLAWKGSSAFFGVGSARFSVRLVDATFPPYAQVIPKSCPNTARVDAMRLVDAVQAVGVSSDDKSGGVVLTWSRAKLEITTESASRGDARDVLEVEFVGAGRVKVVPRYIVDAVEAVRGPEPDAVVEVGFGGELDAVVFQRQGGDALAVVMPQRIGS